MMPADGDADTEHATAMPVSSDPGSVISTPVIDYDEMDSWLPLISSALEPITSPDLEASLRSKRPEYMEDAVDHLLERIGAERRVGQLNRHLAGAAVRVYHGTRLSAAEARERALGRAEAPQTG